jgi:RNA polymerase sigma factor (sigma-70 family)
VESTRSTLLGRVRDLNDHAAWAEFQARYRELLVRFCRGRGLQSADAEDVVQQVFLSLARSLPGFTYDPQRGRFRDYLFRCTKNAVFELSKSPKRTGEGLDIHATALAAAAAERQNEALASAWEQEWVAHHFRLALETVRKTFDGRSVEVFQRSIDGGKVADLAREFGMNEPAVHKVRQRIRDRMEALIAAQISEEECVHVETIPTK